MRFDFPETPPGSITSGWAAGLGPTREALLSRSWLLESGLATQAIPLFFPCLFPPLPRPTLTQPGLARPAPHRWDHIGQSWLCVCTHRWAWKAWLALKSLGEESKGQFAVPPSLSCLATQVERMTA